MTTILADLRLGVMVTDSSVSDGDRVWKARKVFRHKGALIGFAGDVNEGIGFLAWWKSGQKDKPPKFKETSALVLTDDRLMLYTNSLTGELIPSGIEAIGSGAKAAICAYEATGQIDPVRVVQIVCKHDSSSRAPARAYQLRKTA